MDLKKIFIKTILIIFKKKYYDAIFMTTFYYEIHIDKMLSKNKNPDDNLM